MSLQSTGLQKIEDHGKICLPIARGFLICVPLDIRYMRAQSNYTYVLFSSGQQLLWSKTLKDLESLLPSALFVRSHKSYIVYIDYILTYSKNAKHQFITLQTGEEIPVRLNFFKGYRTNLFVLRKRRYLHFSMHIMAREGMLD